MTIDHDKIKKQAKGIMDDFMRELEKVDVSGDFFVHRPQNTRHGQVPSDPSFPERLLENAPHTKQRWILAEKKKW